MKKHSAILALCALLALVTLACYWPVASHEFVTLDDHRYIYENPQVTPGLAWAGVLWAFRSGYAANWHPLTWLSHMADCQLYGLNPAGHHLTNVGFHLANTLLLFLLVRRMTGSLWRSAFVAALFAWHPLHVESVAWASERKDVLSTFFFLLALWAYARYVQAPSPAAAPRGPQLRSQSAPRAARYYILSLLCFGLGLMSKPMVVTLPFVLLLLDFWPFRRLQLFAPRKADLCLPVPTLAHRFGTLWPLVWEKMPFFALALAASVVTCLVQRAGGAVSSLEALPLGTRLANALVVYVRYLFQTFWPVQLAAIYPYSRELSAGAVIAAALFLAGLSAWFLLRARRQPVLLVGWLWWLGTLVPTIGLVQVGAQSMADRYMYIPSIGLFLLIVWGVSALSDQRRLLAAAGTLALAGCLVGTGNQLQSWQNSEQLFRRAIAVTSGNYIAYDGLGTALEARGRREEALACCAEAVRLQPRYAQGHCDLGVILQRMGRLEPAIQHLTAAVTNCPTFVHAHSSLGKALWELGRLEEAAGHLTRAIQLAPADPDAHYSLGTLLLQQTNLAQAVPCFREALRLKPDYGEAHSNLGIALMRQGQASEGAAHLSAAARLNPANPQAHHNFGLALLELNRPGEAAAQFAKALRLRPDAPGLHYHLALALARQDKPQEARAHAQKARDLAQAAGQTALAVQAEELLLAEAR